MNVHAIRSIYQFELARTWRTPLQSIAAPVISTSLYFVVFGSAIGSRMIEIDGVGFAAFIIPGLIMLTLLTESVSNASFGIYFPRFTGTIYEILSAPISALEIVMAYVGAAATKSLILGGIILATARLFVAYEIEHPLWMIGFFVLTATTFSLLGFIIGIWADGFEKLQLVPLLIIAPLTFWRQLLLDRHAAAVLAPDHALQPRRLPDQRLPLELLRGVRRGRGTEPHHDAGLPRPLPRHRLVDVQDGI